MKVKHSVEISADITLTQAEIGALDALFGYDVDDFLKVFYDKMGRAYLGPYEDGIRSLASKAKGCANGMERLKQEAELVLRGTHYPEPRKVPQDEPYRAAPKVHPSRREDKPAPPPDQLGKTTGG